MSNSTLVKSAIIALAMSLPVGLVLAADSKTSSKLSSADSNFIKEAAQGGMMEVELGKAAQDKATNEKVKDFGKEIDAYYDFAYSKHVTLSAGVGYFKPDSEFGDLLGNVDPNTGEPSDDPVTRVTAGARVRF